MMWKKLLATLAAAGIALPLAACGGSPSSSGKVVTLTMWARINPSPDLVKLFNASHPDIQVKLTTIPDAQYVNKLGAAARGNSAPDIVDFDDVNGPLFATTGILADITDKVNSLSFKDSLNGGQSSLSKWNGKWYAVPYLAAPSVMLYNKALFQRAGLDPNKPPATWAEIENAAKKITALGGGIHGFTVPGACGGCQVYTMWPLVWASGGQVFTGPSPSQTTTFATSPQVAAALEFYHRLWQDKVVPPANQSESGPTWGQEFTDGKMGIFLGGTLSIPTAAKAGVQAGVAPIPGQNGGYSTFNGGDLLGIAAGSMHKQQAWTFINWALGQQAQEELAKAYIVPVRTDMLTGAFSAKYPDVAVALKALGKGQVPSSIAYSAIANDANGPWLGAAEQIIFSNANAQQVLSAADAKSRDLIKAAYQQLGQ